MSLKKSSPATPGQRNRVDVSRQELHKGAPEKSLLAKGHFKRQGRGAGGRVTVRHRGGGVKKRLRLIDFKRRKHDITGKVVRFEYDPMRSANVALIQYSDGEKAYILAPEGLEIGAVIVAGEHAEVRPGNALPLKAMPIGVPIHNLELRPGKGGQIVRGAGTSAVVQAKENGFVTVLLPSKELRLIPEDCYATVGQIGNIDWKNRKLGKAGRKRLMGIRPTVRGTAQHPGSHPHGGGEGRSGVGLKHPKTPWGKHAHGLKTRKRGKWSNKWIVSDRRGHRAR